MTVYQLTSGTTDTPGRALEYALLTALAVLAIALVMAVRALGQERAATAVDEPVER